MRSVDPDLRCEVITDFIALERLAGDWERLFRSTAPPGATFQSWPWTRAFWSVYGPGLALCSPVVFKGDTVVAILPVAVRDGTARLIGTRFADYNGVLCDPPLASRALPLMFSSLLDAAVTWRDCVLYNVPGSSPLMALASGDAPGWLRSRLQVTFAYACPTVVNDGVVFDRLTRKESLRRHENRLRRRGTLTFRHVEDRDEILDRHLERFFRMLITRQALNGHRSRFLSRDARAMVRRLVEALDPAGDLRFAVLELDRTPIAYHLGFEGAGKYVWYLPTFDVNLWNDAPGEVLLRSLFRYAHERRLAEFDFTIGDEQYKNRFANQVRQTFTIHVDRDPRLPAVRVRRLARGARDAVRRNPRAIRWARRLLVLVDRLSARLRLRTSGAGSVAGALSARLRRPRTILCHARRSVAPPPNVRARPLTLSALAMLRLEHRCLDDATVQAMRRRMNEDVAWIVSTGAAEHVFWVNASAHGPIDVSQGPGLGDTSRSTLADGLTALLCAVCPGGQRRDVRITSIHRGIAESAARRAGCVPGPAAAALDTRPAARTEFDPDRADARVFREVS